MVHFLEGQCCPTNIRVERLEKENMGIYYNLLFLLFLGHGKTINYHL